jgi:anthranilate phosphoribosyltransferase
MGPIIAGVLAERGCSALVFHGDDGLDELTTADTSTVWVVHAGEVSQTVLDPASLGLPMSEPGDLRGGDAAHNAAVARSVLGGEPGPIRDTVVLNAAAALAAAEGVPGAGGLEQALADGCAKAASALDSGAARGLLDRWVAASQRLAPPPA